MLEKRRAWPPHVGLLLVQVASIVYVGSGAPFDSSFPLDDAWIHQVAARTLADHGTLGVIPGRFGSGTTSLLWVVLLAPNHLLFHAHPYAYAAVLSALLHVAAGQVILRCALSDGWGQGSAFAFAALFAASPNNTWFVFSGMEVCLGTVLLVAATALWFTPRQSTRSAAACGIALGLLLLTRPESAILAATLLALAHRARRPWRHAVLASLPVGLAGMAYLAANLSARGQAQPTTLDGRRWLWMQEMVNWPWYEPRLHLLGRWASRLWTFTAGEPWYWFFWVLVALGVVGAVWCLRYGLRMGSLVVLLLAQLATYLVLLPAEGHGGRYQPLVAGLFLPLACMGGRSLLQDGAAALGARGRFAAALAWLAPAALVPGILKAHTTWASDHGLAVQHVEVTEAGVGRWISRLPPEARVASFDIGAISWYAGRPILDVGGLSDSSVFREIVAGRLGELLVRERINFLVMPTGYQDENPDPSSFMTRLGLVGNNRPQMSPVAEFSSPWQVWLPGVYATLHCSPRQVIYRLEHDAAENPL